MSQKMFEWVVDINIIPGSKYDQRRVQQIIHYWKTTSGEIFQTYTNSSSKNEIEPHILSVHEGKKLLENEKKSLFKCSLCFHDFDRKDKLKRHTSSVHDEKKTFQCKLCPSYFAKKANLTIHMKLSYSYLFKVERGRAIIRQLFRTNIRPCLKVPLCGTGL